LHACGDFRREIFRENKVLNDLTAVGNIIKSTPTAERLQKLRQELSLIQFPVHPDGFLIPTDFAVRVKGLVIEKCKYMDSKKLPLWLVFENADPDGPNVYVIFKVGDDLRQDILTLQMITLMYKQVQNSSLALDLRMRPYSVVATGARFPSRCCQSPLT
jgi:phosphatidylinositol-4,5-bisphosphate 3-kinase